MNIDKNIKSEISEYFKNVLGEPAFKCDLRLLKDEDRERELMLEFLNRLGRNKVDPTLEKLCQLCGKYSRISGMHPEMAEGIPVSLGDFVISYLIRVRSTGPVPNTRLENSVLLGRKEAAWDVYVGVVAE